MAVKNQRARLDESMDRFLFWQEFGIGSNVCDPNLHRMSDDIFSELFQNLFSRISKCSYLHLFV